MKVFCEISIHVNELADEEWHGICSNKERQNTFLCSGFKFLLHESCLSLYTINKYCNGNFSQHYFFIGFWKPLTLWLCDVQCVSEISPCFE
jgi:hypothetical protein